MACTSTKVRPQEATNTWSKTFPAEQQTQQQSALFVKKLLAVAISNVSYLRVIFPEHAFGDRCLEDLNLKILRDDSTCRGASQVIKWVKGCFDALDKGYLRMLILGIYIDPDDPDTLIESYTFKFSYSNDGSISMYRNEKKIAAANSEAETKNATKRLLRTLVLLCSSLKPLPEHVMLTMKLLYYDDVTPVDYEPPGFKASDVDCFQFADEPVNIKVGDVKTSFHTVKLRVKTDSRQFNEEVDDLAVPVEEAEVIDGGLDTEADDTVVQQQSSVAPQVFTYPEEEVDEGISMEKEEPQVVPEPIQCDSIPVETPNRPGVSDQATVLGSVSSQRSQAGDSQEEDMGVRCPCGCNEDDGLMILCAVCKFWQHGVCFKIVEEEDAPLTHICELCADKTNPERLPTDLQLCGMTEVGVQATCLWRRGLMACTEMSRVLAPTLARRLGTEMTVAQGLLHRLEKEGCLSNANKGKRLGLMVNKEKLPEVLKKYFQRKTEKPDPSTNQKKTGTTQSTSPMAVAESDDKEHKKNRRKVDEVEQLTTKAENMKIDGHDNKLQNKNVQVSITSSENEKNKKPQHKDSNNPKKRTRASLTADESFEISNSQDVTEGTSRRKKFKASNVAKNLQV